MQLRSAAARSTRLSTVASPSAAPIRYVSSTAVATTDAPYLHIDRRFIRVHTKIGGTESHVFHCQLRGTAQRKLIVKALKQSQSTGLDFNKGKPLYVETDNEQRFELLVDVTNQSFRPGTEKTLELQVSRANSASDVKGKFAMIASETIQILFEGARGADDTNVSTRDTVSHGRSEDDLRHLLNENLLLHQRAEDREKEIQTLNQENQRLKEEIQKLKENAATERQEAAEREKVLAECHSVASEKYKESFKEVTRLAERNAALEERISIAKSALIEDAQHE